VTRTLPGTECRCFGEVALRIRMTGKRRSAGFQTCRFAGFHTCRAVGRTEVRWDGARPSRQECLRYGKGRRPVLRSSNGSRLGKVCADSRSATTKSACPPTVTQRFAGFHTCQTVERTGMRWDGTRPSRQECRRNGRQECLRYAKGHRPALRSPNEFRSGRVCADSRSATTESACRRR
jgi:hypothetical protein